MNGETTRAQSRGAQNQEERPFTEHLMLHILDDLEADARFRSNTPPPMTFEQHLARLANPDYGSRQSSTGAERVPDANLANRYQVVTQWGTTVRTALLELEILRTIRLRIEARR